MKIAFVINDIKTEHHNYSTIAMAMCAYAMGHTIYIAEVGNLGYTSDGHLGAKVRTVKDVKYKTTKTFFEALSKADPVPISSTDLDVLFLRNNPADEIGERDWAQNAAYIFGQVALNDGVLVLNHPKSLSNAINKMYFQHFPELLRPKTIITRSKEDIHAFFEEQKGKIILKPLQGSGGSNVFMVNKKNDKNINQIIDAIARDGYVIAQEYLPEATKGDTRLFLMNGKPLQVDGKYAALRRINAGDDIRSNIHAGGKPAPAKITPEILELVSVLRPKLVQDGMFLVGADIVGDKLMEINVFSPGGLNLMSEMYGVDFTKAVIHSIEKKVEYRRIYGDSIDNGSLACL